MGLGASSLLIALLLSVAIGLLLPVEAVRTPGRADVRSVIWPLYPALAAMAVPATLGIVARAPDQIAARPAWTIRGVVVALLCLRLPLIGLLTRFDHLLLVRNLLLLDGIALWAFLVLPRRLAWVPVLTFPVCCWLIGVDPPGVPRGWALPLLPADDLGAAIAAGVLWVSGVGGYLARRTDVP